MKVHRGFKIDFKNFCEKKIIFVSPFLLSNCQIQDPSPWKNNMKVNKHNNFGKYKNHGSIAYNIFLKFNKFPNGNML